MADDERRAEIDDEAERLARTMEETETLPADPVVGEWAAAVRALSGRSPQSEDHEADIDVKVCECGATWFGGNEKYCPAGHAYRFRTERYVPLSRVSPSRDVRGDDEAAGHWECNVEHDGEHDEHSCRFIARSPQGEDHEASA